MIFLALMCCLWNLGERERERETERERDRERERERERERVLYYVSYLVVGKIPSHLFFGLQCQKGIVSSKNDFSSVFFFTILLVARSISLLFENSRQNVTLYISKAFAHRVHIYSHIPSRDLPKLQKDGEFTCYIRISNPLLACTIGTFSLRCRPQEFVKIYIL